MTITIYKKDMVRILNNLNPTVSHEGRWIHFEVIDVGVEGQNRAMLRARSVPLGEHEHIDTIDIVYGSHEGCFLVPIKELEGFMIMTRESQFMRITAEKNSTTLTIKDFSLQFVGYNKPYGPAAFDYKVRCTKTVRCEAFDSDKILANDNASKE